MQKFGPAERAMLVRVQRTNQTQNPMTELLNSLLRRDNGGRKSVRWSKIAKSFDWHSI